MTAEYSEGLGQTHIGQRLIDAGADVLFEKSIEMAGGNASVLRYFVDIDRVLEIGVDKGARSFAESVPVVAIVDADRGRQRACGKVKTSRQNPR